MRAMAALRITCSAALSRPRSAGRGRGIGSGAQRDGVAGTPDTHAFLLIDHPDELFSLGVPQRLDDFEDRRRRIWNVQVTLRQIAFSELSRGQFSIDPEMADVDICDLLFLEEPVAHDLSRPLPFGRGE